jgi:hypothetical protein
MKKADVHVGFFCAKQSLEVSFTGLSGRIQPAQQSKISAMTAACVDAEPVSLAPQADAI